MKPEIDREELFKEKLLNGINLFTGAGFSCLPDKEGNQLPIGAELCKEICEKFDISYEIFENDLESVCALADGEELQNFLRKRFTVESFNEKYLLINNISLLSYITTNIDNIIHSAVESKDKYYLKSLTYYGAFRKEKHGLFYIPLHGEVMNCESKLYFGKFDLATADQANSELFQQTTTQLRNTPTLFWGYGFHDSGVLKIVQKLLTYGPQDIWIQCRPSDEKQISLFKSLGCNIIRSDTEGLFDWIKENIKRGINKSSTSNAVLKEALNKYKIPTINQVPAVQATDYYVKGATQWYSILTKQAIELDIVNDVYNNSIKNKNTILIGTDFSGKTTALMQLALKIDAENKLYISNLTPEESKFILKNLDNMQATIFIDNCESDMIAYKILAEAENVRTVATATDYTFEASKHLLEGVKNKLMFVEDFTKEQARRFFYLIEKTIREQKFSYKSKDPNGKFSMLEMMLNNIQNSLKTDRIKQLLLKILEKDIDAFTTVSLAIYLSGNNSALSTDILFSFFECHTYEDTKKYVNEANGLLRELDVSVDRCDDDQDYYDVRSKMFLYNGKRALTENKVLKKAYAKVISDFLEKVSIYKIYQYNLFRRSAYDAKLYFSLFEEKANVIYSNLYDYDSNPYTLQQWALCRAYLKEFKEAFADIDRALRQKPNNFSIKNTSAIILFEANRDENNETGRSKRIEAMQILKKCYTDDKRKAYHANRFAEFAIEIAKIDKDYQFVKQASDWINEIIVNGESSVRYTEKYERSLNKIIDEQGLD